MSIIWKGAYAGNFRVGRPNGLRPEAIVIHIMDGTLDGTGSWFNDPIANVSAHYGVGKGGAVHQYVKEADTAQHAGIVDRPSWPLLKAGVNPNFYTIGIEHEGRDADAYPWGAPQLAASLALVREIAARWSIPLDADHIITHHQIRFGKTCPGSNFDKADYLARLQGTPAPAPAARVAWNGGVVRAVATANVRPIPGTTSAPVGRLLPGEAFAATGLVAAGENVRGNPRWYDDGAGRYLWAGATDRP